MAHASIQRRLLIGGVASTLLALALFAGGLFVVVVLDDDPEERDEGFREEVAEMMGLAMLAAAPLALVASAITAVILSRRIAKPLDGAISAARATTAHDLQRRLPVPERDDELKELILALNDLFARLDDGFGALDRFAADASHELRTPLAVMATELEVSLRHPRSVGEWETTGRTTLAQLHRLSALVDGLLTLARASADPPGARVEVDLVGSLDAVVAQLSAAAATRGVVLEGPSAGIPYLVTGNPTTLDIALRNLIENALAVTALGGHVQVELAEHATDVAITIDDDGPGLGANAEALFTPFVRGDRPADAMPGRAGLGLGLAIARRVAESHGGRLDAGTSPLGGARLTLTLPRKRDA